MGVDPKLIEVARSAEAGGQLPTLRLATAAQLIIGIPGQPSNFGEVTWPPIVEEMRKQAHRPPSLMPSRGKAEAREEEFKAQTDALWGDWRAAARAAEPDPPGFLTLYNALVSGWGESSALRVPAVRVNLDAVTAWWVGTGKMIKDESGLGWFGFVSVPIPLGNLIS
jgi:hypothetical protein